MLTRIDYSGKVEGVILQIWIGGTFTNGDRCAAGKDTHSKVLIAFKREERYFLLQDTGDLIDRSHHKPE